MNEKGQRDESLYLLRVGRDDTPPDGYITKAEAAFGLGVTSSQLDLALAVIGVRHRAQHLSTQHFTDHTIEVLPETVVAAAENHFDSTNTPII